jgi:hypothetical protein
MKEILKKAAILALCFAGTMFGLPPVSEAADVPAYSAKPFEELSPAQLQNLRVSCAQAVQRFGSEKSVVEIGKLDIGPARDPSKAVCLVFGRIVESRDRNGHMTSYVTSNAQFRVMVHMSTGEAMVARVDETAAVAMAINAVARKYAEVTQLGMSEDGFSYAVTLNGKKCKVDVSVTDRAGSPGLEADRLACED